MFSSYMSIEAPLPPVTSNITLKVMLDGNDKYFPSILNTYIDINLSIAKACTKQINTKTSF